MHKSLKNIRFSIIYGIREIKILKKENFFNKKFNRINKLEAQNNFIRDLLLQVPRIIIEFKMVLTKDQVIAEITDHVDF